MNDLAMKLLNEAGLGLDHDDLRLDRTSQRWIDAGSSLRDQVADRLSGIVASVEQIGSSSVLGLLAKPIVDLAVGLAPGHDMAPVTNALIAAKWIFRGDAGSTGGHVFVLEARPSFRVAHLHAVEHDGEQWRNYLCLRDLLRRSADARARYESVKRQLANKVGNDRMAYTEGKSDIVRLLLNSIDEKRT